MYIERTNYYARPGQRDSVLGVRREASEVRPQAGTLPRHHLRQVGPGRRRSGRSVGMPLRHRGGQ